MPRINLLPVRAARRVDTARRELTIFAGISAVVAIGLYYWFASVHHEIDDIEARMVVIKSDITEIEKRVQQVEDFKKKAQMLEQKLAVIERLKKQKTGPAKMLADLATILTNNHKVWLTSIGEKNGLLTLQGGAMDHENISDFQLAMEQQSKFFKDVRLTVVNTTQDGNVRYLHWALTATTNYSAG